MATLNGNSNGNGNSSGRWKLRREQILLAAGLLIAFGEFVNAEILGGAFHGEFLLLATAFCGAAVTQWGDRK